MSDAEYGLLVSFDDESPSFVHGFEAGQVWEQIERKRAVIKKTVHAVNLKLYRRMAASAGYAISVTHHKGFDTWADIELTAKPEQS